jgi:hypothetical protein
MKTRTITWQLSTVAPAAWALFASVAMAQSPQAGTVSQSLFTHEGEAIQVVNTAGFKTAADLPKGPTSEVRPVGFIGDAIHGNSQDNSCDAYSEGSFGNFGSSYAGSVGSCGSSSHACGSGSCGMSSCGTGSCGTGSCGTGTCGSSSCGSCANTQYTRLCNCPYGNYSGPLCDPCYNPCAIEYNPCGSSCKPYSYIAGDYLIMGRDSDGSVDFDWQSGLRATIGKLPDCAFTGLSQFEDFDRLQIRDTATFFDELEGIYDSEFYSVELNRTLVMSDIAKLVYGLRYIHLGESFSGRFTNRSAPVPPSLVPSTTVTNTTFDIDNNLIGAQIGGDFYYPLAKRLNAEFRGRAGAYVNAAELNGDGVSTLSDDEADLAGFFELGMGIRYSASERLTFRAGGELWYLGGVATGENEAFDVARQRLTNVLSLNEAVLFYGLSAGAELKF